MFKNRALSRSPPIASASDPEAKAGTPDSAGQATDPSWAAALQAARAIQDAAARSQALSKVAGEYARIGELDAARVIWADAVQAARAIQDEDARTVVLMRICADLAERGEITSAMEIASEIPGGWERDHALSTVSAEQAKAGNSDAAIQTVRQISEASTQDNAFGRVVFLQALAGEFADALETANEIRSPQQRAEALKDVAQAQAQAGFVDAARETARAIADEVEQAAALAAIAATQAQGGRGIVRRTPQAPTRDAPAATWRHQVTWQQDVLQVERSLLAAAKPDRFNRLLLEGLLNPSAGFLGSLPPLTALRSLLYVRRAELEITDEEIDAWIRIASVLTAPARDQVTEAVESFLDVEIPFSMSPRADKSPLSAIMREAPHAALIPLVPGALQATNLIGQAQYIAALEMAAASGGVTLILVATYNLADLLLNRPLSRLIAERASRQHAINARQDSSAPGNREALSLPDQSAEART